MAQVSSREPYPRVDCLPIFLLTPAAVGAMIASFGKGICTKDLEKERRKTLLQGSSRGRFEDIFTVMTLMTDKFP